MPEPPIESWADPVAAADAAATSLLQLFDDGADTAQAVAAIRKRSNQALMLRLAEIADDSSAVAGFRAGLRDTSWIDRLALEHAGAASYGVISLGPITRAFLTSLADVSAGVPELRTHSRAVARGLGYLGLPIALTDPASSDCLLVPAVARHRERIWTAVPAAHAIRSAVANARAVIVLCHPSSVLSTEGRLAYRPDPILIDVRLTTGVAT